MSDSISSIFPEPVLRPVSLQVTWVGGLTLTKPTRMAEITFVIAGKDGEKITVRLPAAEAALLACAIIEQVAPARLDRGDPS